ncbi:MAG: hypothetical protein SPJ62_10550 [Inconstantimicrobium porci]|uniref:hypothetical protein n=1 Tax=Inconstantimicrobium porci TaxID=2652291 RepID=UPI002A90A526|nr:hypothetical protein [Inconstantimicrobium porci]MDY5912419.1 hypothetical protein [Inconstantimicrobium porci]
MAETLYMISNISFILMMIFLALSIFCVVKFNIIEIIGDLSGITAKKSIKRIRENNEKSGVKKYRPSKINRERGLLTEDMEQSKKLKCEISDNKNEILERKELLSRSNIQDIEIKGTEVLDNGMAVLDDEQETDILSKEINVTGDKNNKVLMFGPMASDAVALKMIDDVVIVHTKEIIK